MYKFEKLKVWSESVRFIKVIYRLIEKLPKSEERNLIDQLRRAVTSISLNIAEGSAAENDTEFKRYLAISRKSLFESIAILKLSNHLYGISVEKELEKGDEIGKMLNGLVKYLRRQSED